MKLGLVGTRGMVGSVLMQRMQEEGDFKGVFPTFFSSSQVGRAVPDFAHCIYRDAYNLQELASMDVIITCQGSDYTEQVYASLRKIWQGYWIDAASHLRLDDEAVICLDPVNGDLLKDALNQGKKTFVGGNCTVSLMLMALSKVLKTGEVESVTSMTYQAASGAGKTAMDALVYEMHHFGEVVPENPMGGPLAGSLLPWIDADLANGISREEAKMQAEAMKITGISMPIPMDSLCVRVGVLRCHSQAITVTMKNTMSLAEFTTLIANNNEWVKVIANAKAATLQGLTPIAVAGSLDIAVGRIRKFNVPGNVFALFTVGDQLLWGAAEPLRRMLNIVREFLVKL